MRLIEDGAVTGPENRDAAPARLLAGAVSALTGRDDDGERGGALDVATAALALVRTVRSGGGSVLADALVEVADWLPIRDLPALQRHYPGLSGEELADALVAAATRATTTTGAALGAVFATEYLAPRFLLSAPAQLAAETIVVAAIEVKLIAELHAVYGVARPAGHGASAYVRPWVEQRGIDPLDPTTTTRAIGVVGKRKLRRRMLARVGTSLPSLAPMLAGAVAGALVNRRETQVLARKVRADLRRRPRAIDITKG